MALEYFPCYYSYRKKLAKLSDQEVGRLFRSLLQYGETGETEELTGRESVAFDFIAEDIDRAKAAYDERCSKNKKNIEERYDRIRPYTNEYDRIPPNTNEYDRTQNKNKTKDKTEDKVSSDEETKGRNARARFTPPSVSEVGAYCLERGNGLDPEAFVSFYASKGWKVGNSPMKDWKAAVRTWEKRRKEEPGKKGAWNFDDL